MSIANGVERRGRQLAIVSSTIAVFAVAHGRFVERAVAGGIAFIEVAYTTPLYVSALLVLGYAMWQLRLVQPQPNQTLGSAWHQAIRKSKAWKREVEKRANEAQERGDELHWEPTQDGAVESIDTVMATLGADQEPVCRPRKHGTVYARVTGTGNNAGKRKPQAHGWARVPWVIYRFRLSPEILWHYMHLEPPWALGLPWALSAFAIGAVIGRVGLWLTGSGVV